MSRSLTHSPAKRILLVEDDAGARESIALLLQIDRFNVVTAANGTEALRLYAREPFDLVITDYFMAGMRGAEVATAIKGVSPKQPVLMVSAFLEKLGPSDTPVDAVLSKPFSVAQMRQAIAALLGPPEN